MRKQIGFTFRVYPVGRVEGTYNPDDLNQEVAETYLKNGWEVINTTVVEYVGNRVMLGVSLVQYEDVPSVSVNFGESEGIATGEEKRKAGRPKKVVEEVAD
jgi:hypothetical protein